MQTHVSYFASFFAIACFRLFSPILSAVRQSAPLHTTMIHHFNRTYILRILKFILVSLKSSRWHSCLCWDRGSSLTSENITLSS
ncbi:uncharacterized protein EDB93DRAFT_1143097 [Suillus bovinus]|uniref:uncharacterized protein n=1 Tax=Suillus bovinus TaxID=48563 RepID=UPI001B862E4E|nr:uncharacterized protein EDB93DRAFT_1143097 [Suillus bovinus]KAG2149012.1 hypothetical protein EDB93DRAFT_1143097 [Suillus bovinus]